MSDGKLSLNLNEENELTFKILIEGSSSDVNATTPHVRFVLSEKDESSNKAWLYPTSKDSDGNVVVSVSGEKHLNEEKKYTGQLEVILGNHYFVPTTVDIEFIKPLKVEAVVVTNKSTLQEENNTRREKPVAVSASTVQVTTKKKITESSKSKPSRKRQWADLTKKEQEKVKKVLRERKMNELREAKALEDKKKRSQKLTEDTIKDQLKSLLSDSLTSD